MSPRGQDSDPLARALQKRAEGRGTSNTEKRLISDFKRERIGRDHFSQIRTAPLRPAMPESRTVRTSHPQTQIGNNKDKLYGGGDDSLAARVAVLEALLSGLTRQTVSYCTSGSTTSKTILMS